MKTIENKTLVDCKIDELLSTRLNLVENKNRIDRLLKEAYTIKGGFPYRWYVTCNKEKEFTPVLSYLKTKGIKAFFNKGCGIGMIDGELLFIPEDCNYNNSKEISIEEFNFIYNLIDNNGNARSH